MWFQVQTLLPTIWHKKYKACLSIRNTRLDQKILSSRTTGLFSHLEGSKSHTHTLTEAQHTHMSFYLKRVRSTLTSFVLQNQRQSKSLPFTFSPVIFITSSSLRSILLFANLFMRLLRPNLRLAPTIP